MKRKKSAAPSVRRLAKKNLGLSRLRPGQEEAIRAVLERRDTLVVMPTGSGKSAIYQVAALQVPGPTVVVSPLIALQQDQVEAIEEQELAGAVPLNSILPAADRREAFEELQSEELEFLFLAPEQLGDSQVIGKLAQAGVSLFVVDEAHCVSEWGHDFRPDYLRLGVVIEELGHPTVLALTATASPPVRDEIVERLRLRNPRIVVQGFDRPEIWLGVESFEDDGSKHRAFLAAVESSKKPGIVYVASRRHCNELEEALRERGVEAGRYHAGMKAAERGRSQDDFMEGRLEVMVATTAFGLGIDKPDVRFVYHYDVPGSLDGYYQEVGRAARDGKPGRAMLFYNRKNLGIQRFLTAGGRLDPSLVETVSRTIAESGPIAVRDLQGLLGLGRAKLGIVLNRLREVGAIEMRTNRRVSADGSMDPGEAARAVSEWEERYRNYQRWRIERMRAYAETLACRREHLLQYFGEDDRGPCGNCDRCDQSAVAARPEGTEPYPVDGRVVHAKWGQGMVLRYEGDKMIVLFDREGEKTLAADLVTRKNLLRRL